MSKKPGIEQLEAAVRRALSEIHRLRNENATLRERSELAQLAQPTQPIDEAGAWARERADLRQRVQNLVDQLEALLADAPDAP